MPSKRVTEVKLALASHIAAFRAVADNTAQNLLALIHSAEASRERKLARTAALLGPFAVHHIDAGRFASLFEAHTPSDPLLVEAARWAHEQLSRLVKSGDAAFVVRVPPGQSLYEAVQQGLASLGRAFQAARVVAQARVAGAVRLAGDAHGFGFARWSKAERSVAPPLVVEVEGADVKPAALAEFLDGWQKIVLVVDGPVAVAALARLITPHTFVAQTTDGAGLKALATYAGPGVLAWVDSGAATFVHDPQAGAAPWQKLSLHAVPKTLPKIQGVTAAQQQEELDLLTELARPPVTPLATHDKVDKLAAWLLREAGP